jgi:hypothetical protein
VTARGLQQYPAYRGKCPPNPQRLSVSSSHFFASTPKDARSASALILRDAMTIRVDSVEYKCWHEVGHATVCLHLGGDVDCIEFLDGDARGYARARCVVTPEIERSVACGGFAAEFYLLNNGYAERAPDDERDISQIVFDNATIDCLDFWGRDVGSYEGFTEAETREFVNPAIGSDGYGGVVPIFKQYFLRMQVLVRELCEARRAEGTRVKELLRPAIHR